MEAQMMNITPFINRMSEFNTSDLNAQEQETVINLALEIMGQRYNPGASFKEPNAVMDYLQMMYMDTEHEVFSAIFLDQRHCIICFEELFKGTIDGASVYPREVVKKAIGHNAAAVLFAHNHPSGDPEPSRADENITQRLKKALALVDIRVLDHFIVGKGGSVSFAQRGLI